MSYQAIARKYRPQTFGELIGQEAVVRTLTNAIENDKVSHAYIFSGTRGVGKTTTARILAKALNCEKGPTTKPCGKCAPCTEIAAAGAVDVIEIDAASNRGIDEIRELRENVRYLPARDRFKVFIIDEVHMLTTEAFNALLKTLEEPPERVVFILATTEPHKIPATIQSRCQSFHFRTVSFAEILARLEAVAQAEGVEIEPEALAILARGGEGSLRDALSLLDQAIAYSGKKISAEPVRELLGVVGHEYLDRLVDGIASQSSEKVLALVDELVRDGHNLQHFCREALRHIRNLMLVKVGGEAAALVEAAGEEGGRLQEAAGPFAEEDLLRYFNTLLKTEGELRYAPQPRLHLELGLLKLVQAARLRPLEEILSGMSGNAAPNPSPAPPATPDREPEPTEGEIEPTTTESATPAPVPSTGSLAPETVEQIKSAVYDGSKFLGSLIDNVVRWDLREDGLHLVFGRENKMLIEMISREQQTQLNEVASSVIGQPTQVHAQAEETLTGTVTAAGSAQPENDSRGETHPTVDALVRTFGGKILPAVEPGAPESRERKQRSNQ